VTGSEFFFLPLGFEMGMLFPGKNQAARIISEKG
jgi:hypothetical protein